MQNCTTLQFQTLQTILNLFIKRLKVSKLFAKFGAYPEAEPILAFESQFFLPIPIVI